MPEPSPDLLIVGGGVIGLSIACEAAAAGLRVTLVERGEFGREASWAGAGILPPRSWYTDHAAVDWLAELADPQHETLSRTLREEVGVDDQYVRCGSRYDLRGETDAVVEGRQTLDRWCSLGVSIESDGGGRYIVPAEAQVRNPRRLCGLVKLAEKRGCKLYEQQEVVELLRDGDDVVGVRTATSEHTAGVVCLAAGCWTPGVATRSDLTLPGKPMRGQMLLLRVDFSLGHILHVPPWYAAPRRDGLVLVGATLEDVGFDKATTDDARRALADAARRLDSRLADATVEGFWAGLRPAGPDALPQIGWASGAGRLLVATAHYRSGLQLAPPTAELIVDLLLGNPILPEAGAFDPCRFAEPATQTVA